MRRLILLLILLMTARPVQAALSSCETHWGESPSAELRLPADLAITPGGLAGKWHGNYATGREVMLVVTRIDGETAQGLLITGSTESQAGGSTPETGQAIDGNLVFTVPNRHKVTLIPAADGSASLLWVSADEKHRLVAVLHRVP